ncbi:MAG: CHAT domain-containing protein, partial [Verrucomicrobiota bacterium]
MSTELNLRFPDAQHVIVRLGPNDDGSRPLSFSNPITDIELLEIQWYVETYGAHSLGDPDDTAAAHIKGMLPVWGKKLFEAVFKEREALERLLEFRKNEDDSRLLTISTEHPAILVLPWELLHDPAPGGGFLFMETPRISIRRRVAGATGGRGSFKIAAKDSLRLLFVVSRPDDAGFLDPRADSLPVLDAIDEHAPGRVICEFLRPPTLDALIARLEDKTKPPVDIVRFDGHGVFDRDGGLPERAAKRDGDRFPFDEITVKEKTATTAPDSPANTGYLLFEQPDGKSDFVSAERLGANLHRHKVALVILSACQSAAVEKQDAAAEADAAKKPAMGSVAARLTTTGIPSVLAMSHSVLVATTRTLFGEFYKELAQHKGIGEALDNARRYLANHPEKFEVQRGPERVKLKLYDWFLPALYQPGADGPLLKERAVGTRSTASQISVKVRDGVESVPTAPRTNLPQAPEAGFFGRKRALWEIERWFAGPTRRITLTGFGGQGKTALAQEAGRWLLRAGLFRAAVFVDYSRIQSSDAVSPAVANIGTVLGETLIDADAATAALKQTPTLIILDNLEALAPESLQALLSAAVPWSGAGGSRVLCTTRR